MKSNLTKKIIILMVSFLICLFCLEWLSSSLLPAYNPRGRIRGESDQNGVPLGIKNSIARQQSRQGEFDLQIKINKYGFRDIKDIKTSSKNVYLVIGDSHPWGFGVEENKRFSNLIEGKLNVPVYNISIMGTDIKDYRKLVEYAMQNGANINNLIITISMVNDIIDYENVIEMPKKTKNEPKFSFQRLKEFLWERLTIYNVLVVSIHTYLDRHPLLNKYAVKYKLISSGERYVIQKWFSEKKTRSSAKELSKLASKFNSIVLLIPSRELWLEKNGRLENNRRNELLTHNYFIELLKKLNFKFIDLKPVFEKDGEPLKYYYKYDGHMNNLGHQIAAEELIKVISTRESLKAGSTRCGPGTQIMGMISTCSS